MDRVQPHGVGDLHAGVCLRHLRGHDHAAGDPDPDQGVGHRSGDDGRHHDAVGLGRPDRRFHLSGARRSLRPPAHSHSDDPRLFAVHRLHRLCARSAQLLIFTSITRIALRGETPVGMVMVSETAPTKWRATALGGLVGGYPFGYMLCSLTALVVVPLWGWRALYWLGILPALLVLWVRLGVEESPRFERVTTAMLREGLRKRLDFWSPVREYPREMLTATLLYFFYLFTWIGWSAWMPQYLANEKHLGFQTTASYLSVWMSVGLDVLCNLCLLPLWLAQRPVWPALCHPGLLPAGGDPPRRHGTTRYRVKPVLGGVDPEFPDYRQLRQRARLQYRIVPDTDPRDCGRHRFHVRQRRRSSRAGDRRLDRDVAFDRDGTAAPCPIFLPDRPDVPLRRAGNDASGAR